MLPHVVAVDNKRIQTEFIESDVNVSSSAVFTGGNVRPERRLKIV